MTSSRHDITALLVHSGGAFSLKVIDARITLDDGWSPYAQATVTVATPEESLLDLIDPREGVRVGLTATRDLGAQARGFDLTLVERTVDHEAGTTSLTLASDEAILQTFARVATTVDTSAKTHQASLRNILDETVLDSIGASLEAGDADWDATIDSDATNLASNPTCGTNTTQWYTNGSSGVRLTGLTIPGLPGVTTGYRATHTAVSLPTGYNSEGTAPYITTTPGEDYTVSVWIRSSVAKTFQPYLGYRNSPSGTYLVLNAPLTVDLEANVWARVSWTHTAPTGTTNRFGVFGSPTTAWAVGNTLDMAGLVVTQGADDVAYFDGSLTDTGLFSFAWTGTAHASTSTRTGLVGRSADMLDWEPGETAWDYIAPLVQASGLRLYCDEERQWFLVDPTMPVDGQINITEGVNVTEGRDTISVSKDWYDAVVIEYSWTDSDGTPQKVWDAAGASPTTVLTLKHERPYPGPGAAQAVLSRAEGRGRVLDLSALSNYTTTPGMAIQATLPDSPIQTGYISAVTWGFPADEMTVKSRGLVDTPATAWVFLADGDEWTDSPVSESWITESVS